MLPFPISIHWIYSICSLTWVISFYKCAMFMHHAKTNFQSLRTWPGCCKQSNRDKSTSVSHVICGQPCLHKTIYTLTIPSLLYRCKVGKMSWLWSINKRRHLYFVLLNFYQNIFTQYFLIIILPPPTPPRSFPPTQLHTVSLFSENTLVKCN